MTTALVNHLWQSTVVVLAAAVVVRALHRNQARVRHAVWLTASLKFLVPFSMMISLGAAFAWRSAPTPAGAAAPAFVETIQTITEPFAGLPATPGHVDLPQTPAAISGPAVLGLVWLGGCLVVIAMRLRGWLKVRAALRASTATALSGVDGSLDVRATPGLLEPGVVGIWRPVLLLPVGLESALTSTQLHAVVVHETHHIRRRDNLTSAMHMVVEAVFWFHPLVWWVGARLIDERERACDEYVIASGATPVAYAEAILNVCKQYVESPVACVAGVTGSDLRARVSTIMSGNVGATLSAVRKIALTIVAVAALAVPLVTGMLTAPVRATTQTSSAPAAKFEAVSVRPCAANEPGSGRGAPLGDASPGRLYLNCYSVLRLIQTAYATYADGRAHAESELPVVPVSKEHAESGMDHTGAQGVPDWVSRDRFTIEAKVDGTPPALVMIGPMLQQVLEDRFKVKVHREMRETSVYEMVTAKGGAKVKPITPASCVPYDMSVSPQPPLGPGQHRCSNGNTRDPDGNYIYNFEAITLDDFAAQWSKGWVIDRPIVNKTGITGLVTFQVVQSNHATSQEDASAAMIAELKNRLGLELRPGKARREFLIIDHVEPPTPDSVGAGASVSSRQAQGLAPAQKFDVASIRPCDSTSTVSGGGRNGGGGPVFSPGTFVYNCGTLEQLINGAYVANGDPLLNDEGRAGPGQPRDEKTFPQRIRGGPDWMRKDRFMIEAKTSVSTGRTGREAVPERAVMMGPMLRALLEDRFKLTLHREVQDDVPMYALTVAKGGLKIKPAGPDSCAPPDPNRSEPYTMQDEIETVRKGGKPICGHGIMGGPAGPNNALVLNGQTMAGVARFLSGIMDRHVLDRTGVTDQFVIYLEYAPDDLVPYDFLILPRTTDPPTAPSITQVLKSLGLELQPTKGPKGYIVIDHVERPTFASASTSAKVGR